MHLFVLFHEFLVHLFPHTFFGMFAPLDARDNVIIDNKAAFLAGDLEIVGKDLDLLTTPGAFFNCQGRRPLICGTRAPVKHGHPFPSGIPSGVLLYTALFSLTGHN